MKMIRDGEVQDFSAKLIRRMTAIGWTPVVEKADDEIIRLKPPVKTKNTAKILDEANKSKGDE